MGRMIYYNHILHKVMALLLIVSTALCLCLFTGCNKEKLPETGKYNTMIVLGGDGTKALDHEEVRSIVIYAFASGSDNLVGYLYEKDIDGQDTFPMNLTAGGYIDFYVILNPVCDGFEIIDDSEHLVDFSSREGLTPETIQNWKLRRTTDETPGKAVPMSNLEPDRKFEVVANRNSWQEIPIQVTRAVSKMEVWFWANDNLPEDNSYNYEHYYTAINEMALKDPVSSTEIFQPQGADENDYILDGNVFNAEDNIVHDGLTGERFKPYTTGEFYSDNYFRLIWEEYILPNTFFGGEWNGEPATFDGDYTTLSVSYTHYYSYAVDKGWQAATSKDKVISLPKSPRNTKIIVWCQLHDNTDRSFTYEVVDWDETVTMDVPEFD
ncbi:MAG: hypothetical protein BHV78_07810 [Bacteroides sp. CAG:1060_57_27]|nr:MAG: hypothetical protein BHV78_07810 [Bacteroides sp. CAG:1060_57_27]